MSAEQQKKICFGTVTLTSDGTPTNRPQALLLGLVQEDQRRGTLPGKLRTPIKHGTTAYLAIEVETTREKETPVTDLKNQYTAAINQWNRDGLPNYSTMTEATFRQQYLQPQKRRGR